MAAHRELLVARSAVLRGRFADKASRWEAPLSVADTLVDGARWLRRNPEWPAGVALVLLIARPRRVLRWTGRGLWAWQLWRRARPFVRSAQRWWALHGSP